jgi:hypothetical protein
MTIPITPEAMVTPNANPMTSMIITCKIVVRAALKSLPNNMDDLLMGATRILSMKPLSKSVTTPIPALSAEEAIVWIITAAVKNVM